uniref:Cadherin domain-containing protein n=1 Tax=Pyxicephalus adspersus TaxID=30357 RepID=A0AAV3AU02_PYXAD|nr:TPA: hypothetical protein GDO54_006628 [Pyxicephalus adspersus]
MAGTKHHTLNCKGIRWQVLFSLLFAWLCHSVSGQIHYSIVEEMRKDSVIANIAKDLGLDIKQLSSRKLQMVSDISQKFFYLDLNNGNLYVKDRIDRETLCGALATCFLTFDVLAENPLNVFKVNVEIQDINDNSPVFFQDTINLQILESASVGAHFALKNAEDLDIGINSVQTYRLIDNQYFTLTEKVSSDGSKSPELILNKALDREIQNSHELILTALDGGHPGRTGTALITITIKDANDNYPIFRQEIYKVSIKENFPINSTVIIVEATDKDEGSNAQITYSFTKTSGNVHHTGVFSIHPINGYIEVTKLLDFELTKNYDLSIQAVDGGGLTAHTKVLIEVEDENDNAPDIFITSLSSPIAEDSASGTAIALVRVRDKDSGENGDVDCHILEPVPFQLVLLSDNYYRIITTSEMDREKVAFYNIAILASDKGSPSLSSQKKIRLEISDVNDNPPVFMKSNYVTYIPENNVPGVSIYSIQASDPDTGDNAKITYSILNTIKEDILLSSYLSINSETGVLYAQRSFDYEKQKELTIEVTAMDHGSPSLNTSTKLIIHIVDRNDNTPKILYPSPENAGSAVFEMVPFASVPGSLITKVVAVDADSGHNSWLSYHFIQVPEAAYFIIDEYTGEIRTSRFFQEKDILNHKIVAMVKDNGHPPLSATVTLSLAIADNVQQVVPKLSNQATEEDPQTSLQLYLIIALALISLLFIVTVIIVIISKFKESRSLQSFGPLGSTLYPQIEPRMLPQYTNGTLTLPYNFCVALESTEHDFTFIKPNENDINDNAPLFYRDGIIIAVLESTPPGSRFVLQNAEDPDIGINSVQSYKLSDNKHFTLSENLRTDGILYLELVKPLDRETESNHYLILTAIDGGNPVRSGTVLIRINVTDANDHFPVFSQEVYKITINENISIHSTIITVNATDKDEGLFSIHPTKGEIQLEKKLDYEDVKMYELSIQAKDGGDLTVHCKVLVDIIDENDNAPVISVTSLLLAVPEDSESGTVVALINVYDQDSGENGEVDCQIIEKVPFSLLLSSNNYYRLTTTARIDREHQTSYNITVIATDKGFPPLSSRRVITLEVSDVNDNAPMFMKSSYIAYVPENNLPGASIYSMQASDPDTGDNAKITYSIFGTNTDTSSYLSINRETGVIYAYKSFDYEKNNEFIVLVNAKDNGSPFLDCNATLIIRIVDQNDNTPKILYPSTENSGQPGFEMVPFSSEKGSLLTKVIAVDEDSGHNAWLSYYFVQSSEPSHFIINERTGEIRTEHVFQEKDILNYKIVVMVKDNGDPFLSATVTLSLVVADHFQQVIPKLINQLTDEDPQSDLQIYLVIALGLISLLFIVTVIIVIISKCKEAKALPAFDPIHSSLYSHVDPRILSQYSNGTLTLPYSYNVCVALDSSDGEFTYMAPNQNVPVDNLIEADDSGLGMDNLKVSSPNNNELVVSICKT